MKKPLPNIAKRFNKSQFMRYIKTGHYEHFDQCDQEQVYKPNYEEFSMLKTHVR